MQFRNKFKTKVSTNVKLDCLIFNVAVQIYKKTLLKFITIKCCVKSILFFIATSFYDNIDFDRRHVTKLLKDIILTNHQYCVDAIYLKSGRSGKVCGIINALILLDWNLNVI